MTPAEVAQMFAHIKTLDQRFRIPEMQEERDLMIGSWSGLLGDVPMAIAHDSVGRHYAATSNTITPNVILMRWRSEKSRTAYDANQGQNWRKCRIPACSCTHTECADGWLDEEVAVVRNGMTYRQVQRCPRCSAYLEEIKRQRDSGKPW